MKKRIRAWIPYIVLLALDFYLLPLLIRDTGSGMLMLLCIMPLTAFICALIGGIRRGFDLVLPLAGILLFAPTVLIYYNATAWPYGIVYGGVLFAGAGLGGIFYKRR